MRSLAPAMFLAVTACGALEAEFAGQSLSRTLPELAVNPAVRAARTQRNTAFNQVTCAPDDPPVATANTISLWPPNHSLWTISAADCVTIEDHCDGDLEAQLLWASSDEPINSIGDGNTEGDIVAGCDAFEVRSERQGPRNGRVYHLGWRVEDSGGNVVEGTCSVVVDHDQSAAITEDDGEAYRVDLDLTECVDPNENPCPDLNNPECL